MSASPDTARPRQVSLEAAPFGVELAFTRAEVSPPLSRRLSALGFRRGAPLQVVQRASGGGRVVSVAGARIALGSEVLANAFAEVVE